MSKHYNKLILMLIPACTGFCLALALGSAEEAPAMCQLCSNKALVKAAILAFDEHPYDANMPEQYDPNYVQHSPDLPWGPGFDYRPTGPLMPETMFDYHFTFQHIIAEGDMVSVRVSWPDTWSAPPGFYRSQFAIYRIANGKIVEAWISDCSRYFKP